MSARIETTNSAPGLLRELPSRWARTVVTSPSRDRASAALLAEIYGVLREDAALWVLCADMYLFDGLAQRWWMRRSVDWAAPLRVDPVVCACRRPLEKQPRYRYLYDTTRPNCSRARQVGGTADERVD
jgi:hypothetical protein